MGLGIDQDAHDFARRDLADDLAIDPRDGREFPRPVGAIGGPANPGSLVGLPFSGQAKPEGGGRFWRRFGHLVEKAADLENKSALHLVEKALVKSRVSIDAAVPQERPVAPHFLDAVKINLTEQDFLSVHCRLGQHHAKRIREE